MDAYLDSHEHVLRPLDYLPIALEQVSPEESLESEEVIFEVSFVVHPFLDLLVVGLDDLVDLIRKKRGVFSIDVLVVVELLCYV